MLRIIVALSIAMLCTTSNAEMDIEGYCLEVAKLSRAVMSSRQLGGSIENALEVRDGAFKKTKNERDKIVHTEIILGAYEVPRYFTDEFIQSEIDEFAAKNYIACMQGLRLAKKHGRL